MDFGEWQWAFAYAHVKTDLIFNENAPVPNCLGYPPSSNKYLEILLKIDQKVYHNTIVCYMDLNTVFHYIKSKNSSSW